MTPYRYTVDGEKVTLDDIVARCPLVSRQTLLRDRYLAPESSLPRAYQP